MGIKVALEHRTSYTFDRLVEVHPHVIRLRPAPHSRTPIEAYSLTIEPDDHFVNWQQDAFGNFLARVVFPTRTRQLTITVGLIADLKVINPFDFFIEEYAERIGFAYPRALAEDLKPYLKPVDEFGDGSGPGDLVQAWVKNFTVAPGTSTIEFLVALNRAINADVGYSVRLEPGVHTPDHTLRVGIGSCRDSAWLLVSILRQLGLAARFVSGYLVQLTSDVQALDGPSGPAADFTDLHAWTEVYIPGAGWIGLDPTSGLFAGEGHIPLSATPHPDSAAPITGATEPCESTLDFANLVTRVHEDPRVTLPYTETAWDAVCALGARVDDRLTKGDVRLTVGGEPTFVSVDNRTDPEWTTAADGPHKRERASALAAGLKTVWAPQGLVQRGQGKWYPGEPLPRWQIGLYWRTDGAPLWTDASLLADPWGAETHTVDDDAARRLLAAVAAGLGLPGTQVRSAFEDPLSRLAAAARRPAGEPVAPDDDLADDTARARADLLARLDTSVTEPAAFVLPLHRRDDDSAWASADWRLRRGRIVLLDGDSPAGLRLPLDAISWQPPRPGYPADPLARRGALASVADAAEQTDAEVEDADSLPTTAMVTEVRDRVLYVFLPPTEELEHFVDLVGRIETAASAIGCPVVIEGYPPPADPRLTSVTITPDPGVIEVNVAPTASFAEQRTQLETLYEQARLARLTTEQFDVDGTHGGTGGGNHITLGGPTPADSPLLRRPDLLVSMLTYWQRHPALSYLFAGRFIGTTSQAPRVDEGRSEALYELEIAFAEIARLCGGSGPKRASAWVTDRALRHLLTDITGNTHRAEFCIDKLYSPDSARGRLGLLELRGFEMPPHFQMAMVQSLLVRALVAWFWDEPLRAPLIRHGANLHGRYLLPHFLIHDIADVAADLRAHDIHFDTSWLDPFTEFRFPRIGAAVFDGVEIELRGAIEPWNVLGEQATAGGTARYVDSSVERLQVRLIGADRHRYLVTCNGHPIPMLATDNPDIQVGGVRYRAWQPPSALHPTITVDGPLRFELVDTAGGVSRGGCTYHVAHPGGRSYDTPPVNAVEAESRRGRRFEATGFTPGRIDLSDLREKQARQSTDLGAPGILDLRRVRTVLR
ncbi:transglutaminase family protein [Mycolicibacterium monacense]|uniref:Transglutaminase n=2 Tax=Mycobacteriaceae TaxID=1762 RepID=A0AAD1IWR7_MYCMB|nr:transglutaminase family protein [Mycolicibacterium monacense]MDA4105100.1 transglutaminase [Mycolicibacterium monacense DSM 44395]ORB19532.1 transglutaminase [Mycolicibacterium monacense DSM 44395]QHP86006.1 transglutaminase family protein [Mycolicibacterium monacense DSM 44395]BBZ61052.1 transglutaminase [Mycolicibacterium monacense]